MPSGHWQNNGEKTLSVVAVTKQKQTFSIAAAQQREIQEQNSESSDSIQKRIQEQWQHSRIWAEERQLDSQSVKLSKYSLAQLLQMCQNDCYKMQLH